MDIGTVFKEGKCRRIEVNVVELVIENVFIIQDQSGLALLQVSDEQSR